MRKLTALHTAVLGAFAFVTAAAAKEHSNESIGEALLSSDAFAACVVKKRPDEARYVVLHNVLDVQKRFPRLLDHTCLPVGSKARLGRMRFPSDTFHQALANALVRVEFGVSGPSNFDSVPDAPTPYPYLTPQSELEAMPTKKREAAIARNERRLSWHLLNEMGHCVARRSPEKVRSLALTPVRSLEEQTVMKSLNGEISSCLPSGGKFKMRISDIRGPIVRNFYHLARYLIDAKSDPIAGDPDA